ncbi:MAG: hypothetical protein IJC99_07345 [Clostridia bacterium]|nr:hypothetical protein [Clostridia bacterium]
MRKRLLAILLALCLLAAFGCNRKKPQTSITFSENGVLTAEIPTAKRGSVILPTPAGTHAAHCIGWSATTNQGAIFLPMGAEFSYNRGDDIDFSPVYLHLTTLSQATIDLTAANGGIQYTTTINAGEWEQLLAVNAAPTCGTLILPQSDREALSAFTHDSIAAAAIATARDYAADINADKCGFQTLFTEISTGKRLTPYTAVGYVKLTYSNGDTTCIYANYKTAVAPIASLLGLAKAAMEDLSDVQTDRYITPVGEKFSPYTPEEYAKLKEYSALKLTLIINHENRGNRGLSADLLDAFDERTIEQGVATCADEWRILRGLITDIKQNGALVITAKDGTYIERENISEIVFQNKLGNIMTISNAVFYNGSIYVPYTTYSGNY